MYHKSKETLVGKDLAIRLREAGFNYPTYSYQVNAENGAIISGDIFAHNLNPDRIALPSLALAVQWLSDEKEIDVVVKPTFKEGRKFTCDIFFCGLIINGRRLFSTRDDAIEAGIEVALKIQFIN